MSARLPGSFYDLSAHLGEARAVAGCLIDAMPAVERDPARRMAISCAVALAGAVASLLEISERDLEEMERQMIRVDG